MNAVVLFSAPGEHRWNGLMIDEASLYDRQIRLWGLEAQNRYVLLSSILSPSFLSRGKGARGEVLAEEGKRKWFSAGGRKGKGDKKEEEKRRGGRES